MHLRGELVWLEWSSETGRKEGGEGVGDVRSISGGPWPLRSFGEFVECGECGAKRGDWRRILI